MNLSLPVRKMGLDDAKGTLMGLCKYGGVEPGLHPGAPLGRVLLAVGPGWTDGRPGREHSPRGPGSSAWPGGAPLAAPCLQPFWNGFLRSEHQLCPLSRQDQQSDGAQRLRAGWGPR